MTTRQQAYDWFRALYQDIAPHWGFGPEEEREFEDWWKNASADSHMLQGTQYQRTWIELMPEIRARVERRFAEGKTGVEVEDSNLVRSFTNEELDPLYASGAIPLPAAVASAQSGGSGMIGSGASGDMSLVYGLTTNPQGQPGQPNGGGSAGWTPQPTSGLFGPSPSVAAVGSGGSLSLRTPSGGINWFLILAVAAGVWFVTRKS